MNFLLNERAKQMYGTRIQNNLGGCSMSVKYHDGVNFSSDFSRIVCNGVIFMEQNIEKHVLTRK